MTTEFGEPETILELVQAVQDAKTGGHDVEFTIEPNRHRHSTPENNPTGPWFWTVIEVRSGEPNPDVSINGQWWFGIDGRVDQVL